MFCRKCGTENADGSPSCISCGEPLVNPFQASNAPVSAGMAGEKPKNYLVQSIIVTLCCCLPVGVVSIVYAAQVDSKWNGGDYVGAIEASRKANTWSWVAFGLGLVVNLIVAGINFAGIAAQQQGGGF